MSFVRIVALRYLSALKRKSFISIISAFSIAGVSLGVASLIVVMGVMTGFTNDLRDKILGANAHILVFSHIGSIDNYEDVMDRVQAIEGVKGITPFIYSEAMLSANGVVKGLALRGVDPDSAEDVLGIFKLMTEGSLQDLAAFDSANKPSATPETKNIIEAPITEESELDSSQQEAAPIFEVDSAAEAAEAEPVTEPIIGASSAKNKNKVTPGIIIGKELAKRMSLKIGSRVSVLSPSGEKSAAGFNPRILPFQVCGVFATGMFEYDNSMAFVSLESARGILSLSSDKVFGLEVVVSDIYKADIISKEINSRLKGPLYSRHWMDMNANLFAALKLEKAAMGVILTFIVLVGSFSIITSLVMLVMEKKRDIAILMSMGATSKDIRNIFMLQGLIIGFIGTAIGNIIGLGIAFLVEKYQIIKLPEGVYSTEHLTVLIEWPDIFIISASAMLICFLATLYPAKQASSLRPVEALRQE